VLVKQQDESLLKCSGCGHVGVVRYCSAGHLILCQPEHSGAIYSTLRERESERTECVCAMCCCVCVQSVSAHIGLYTTLAFRRQRARPRARPPRRTQQIFKDRVVGSFLLCVVLTVGIEESPDGRVFEWIDSTYTSRLVNTSLYQSIDSSIPK
jgi:hypothetical protein